MIVQSAKVFAPSSNGSVGHLENQTEDKDKGSKHKSISRMNTLGQRGLWRPYYEAKCKTDRRFFRLYVCHDTDSSDEVVMLMNKVKNGGVVWR